jgi:nucleoside-diphosphate-sugar epimerase
MQSLNGQTVFLTGATGFVGGALAHALARQGAVIRALARDRARAGYIADLPNLTLIDGHLSDNEALRLGCQGASIVIHVAAATSGALAPMREANVEGTRRMAEAAAAAGVSRFVHISSLAIYGFEGLPDRVSEDFPPAPSRYAYTLTKREAETVLRETADAAGMAYSLIRPGMIYGPRSGLWTRDLYKLARLPMVPFLGNGSGNALPIHVDDVVALTLLCAVHQGAVGEAFNCAPDPGISWRAFLGGYAKLAGGRPWLPFPVWLVKAFAPLIARLSSDGSLGKDFPAVLAGNTRAISFSMEKAARLLDFRPAMTLEQGMASCVAYLRAEGFTVPGA